jgi:hypothetical protein
MSDQISTAFVKQFGENITLLSQQRGSKLRGTVMEEPNVTGETVFMDQIGPTEAQRVTTRHADSPQVNTPHARRRITLIDVDWGDLIDDFDKLKTLIDPESAYALNAAYAIGREIDDIIIEQYFADAATGKEGTGTVSFPASQQIAVGFSDGEGDTTDAHLTVGKLRQARTILKQNEVDLDNEMPFMGVNAEALNNLLSQEKATSADYAAVKALVDGEINTYMGFRFVESQRWQTDGSGNDRLPAWVPSGMGLAVAQDPTSRITERGDKRFSTYVYYMTSVGASRLEEDKVVEVKVDPDA